MSLLVECPCCHGEQTLATVDPDTAAITINICCHCQGEGRIPAEAKQVLRTLLSTEENDARA